MDRVPPPPYSVVGILLFWILLALGCSSANRNDSSTTTQQKATGETLPVTASAYEEREPLTSAKIATTVLSDRFARRVFKDPARRDNWAELIIGTGNNTEKVYGYFYFVDIDTIKVAERDEKQFRWGLICGKYLILADLPMNTMLKDPELVKECKDSAQGFCWGLKDQPASGEGIDIRGIHLQLKRHKGNIAEIVGLTSDQWDSIRRATMRGQNHELYSLFP